MERSEAISRADRRFKLFSKPPSFANALVQNIIGGGNTMVFNQAARSLLMQAGSDLSLIAHDWWTYIVVTGCGGQVHYDAKPSLRYRQHHRNLIGRNDSLLARITRLKMLWNGHLSDSNYKHLVALERVRGRLTPENVSFLKGLSSARGMRLAHRLKAFRRTDIHRQTSLGNLGVIDRYIGATHDRKYGANYYRFAENKRSPEYYR